MATPRGFALLLLAVAGALSGHWIGTTVAAPAELVDHGYLGVVGALVFPLAVLALAGIGVRGARTAGLDRIDLRVLLGLQAGVFVAQELVELASAGVPLTAFVTEPAILVGLAAQLPVALVLGLAVRLAQQLAAHWIARPPGPDHAPPPFFTPGGGLILRPALVRVRGPRGPPRLR